MLLLHELAHVAAPAKCSHGKHWKQVYAKACEEAWGVGSSLDSVWKIDEDIRDQIDKKLERKKRGQEKQREEESAAEEAAKQEGDKAPKAA
jgi:hypothetical protein